jgi:hypothetical protein
VQVPHLATVVSLSARRRAQGLIDSVGKPRVASQECGYLASGVVEFERHFHDRRGPKSRIDVLAMDQSIVHDKVNVPWQLSRRRGVGGHRVYVSSTDDRGTVDPLARRVPLITRRGRLRGDASQCVLWYRAVLRSAAPSSRCL